MPMENFGKVGRGRGCRIFHLENFSLSARFSTICDVENSPFFSRWKTQSTDISSYQSCKQNLISCTWYLPSIYAHQKWFNTNQENNIFTRTR